MVQHSPQYPKVKGLSPTAGVGGTGREKVAKKSWANVVKLSCGSLQFYCNKRLVFTKKLNTEELFTKRIKHNYHTRDI
jgi:hypothetical protein